MSDSKLIRKADGAVEVSIDGLRLPVGSEAMNDFELFDQLNRFNETNAPMLLPRIVRGLFGDDAFDEVMNHLRDPETMRVSFVAVVEFLGKVLELLDPKSRNSSASGEATEDSSPQTSSDTTEQPQENS